jgi:exodeoxyribonuclease X
MATEPLERHMIIRCCDFETLGLTPEDGGVCELGWTDVEVRDGRPPIVYGPTSMLVDPGRPIPAVASGVHHIVDAMVKGKSPFSEAARNLLDGGPLLCAHNAKFERQFFTVPAQWICTWKVAVMLAPGAPDHKLQTLRYWLKLELEPQFVREPHRAGPDSYTCAHLLARMLKKLTPDQMVEISNKPVIMPRFHFGEHSGKPVAEIPTGYLEWMLKQDFDEDQRATALHHVQLRRQGANDAAGAS